MRAIKVTPRDLSARTRQFIEKQTAEPLSLGRVAQAANISRHYFCKMFKKATGMKFHRLPLKSPSREIEDALTQSQLAN
jgi:AraC-like DNA-binding protein